MVDGNDNGCNILAYDINDGELLRTNGVPFVAVCVAEAIDGSIDVDGLASVGAMTPGGP